MNESTVLRLSGAGVPPYSARGLSQSLVPIGQATAMRRTINGTLVDLSDANFRQYASVIRGGDMDPPVAVWPGTLLTVDCIAELCEPWADTEEPMTEGTEPLFSRPAVPGSIRYADGFVFYRPRLSMRVTEWEIERDEWGAAVDWTLTLEEAA